MCQGYTGERKNCGNVPNWIHIKKDKITKCGMWFWTGSFLIKNAFGKNDKMNKIWDFLKKKKECPFCKSEAISQDIQFPKRNQEKGEWVLYNQDR